MTKTETANCPTPSRPPGTKAAGKTAPATIKRWDTDKDGKLSKAEQAAARKQNRQQRQKLLERWDKNGDGKLSDAERELMKKAPPAGASTGKVIAAPINDIFIPAAPDPKRRSPSARNG